MDANAAPKPTISALADASVPNSEPNFFAAPRAARFSPASTPRKLLLNPNQTSNASARTTSLRSAPKAHVSRAPASLVAARHRARPRAVDASTHPSSSIPSNASPRPRSNASAITSARALGVFVDFRRLFVFVVVVSSLDFSSSSSRVLVVGPRVISRGDSVATIVARVVVVVSRRATTSSTTARSLAGGSRTNRQRIVFERRSDDGDDGTNVRDETTRRTRVVGFFRPRCRRRAMSSVRSFVRSFVRHIRSSHSDAS